MITKSEEWIRADASPFDSTEVHKNEITLYLHIFEREPDMIDVVVFVLSCYL